MKWDDAPVPKRVRMVKRAGLDSKVGSRSWTDLSLSEQTVIKKSNALYRKMKRLGFDTSTPDIPNYRPKPLDYLMWVGSLYYTRYTDYIKEARRMGCCKRLGHELHNMEVGVSRMFLAHDEGIVGEGFIFGYFLVSKIEVVTGEMDKPGDLPFWASEQCTPVPIGLIYEEEERGCGYREEGGLYAVSETNREELRSIAKKLEIKYSAVGGGFVAISPPIAYEGKHFRGAMAIDGSPYVLEYPEGPPRFQPMSDNYPVRTSKKALVWTDETEALLMETVEEMLASDRPRAQAFARVALMLGIKRTRVISRFKTITAREGQDEG